MMGRAETMARREERAVSRITEAPRRLSVAVALLLGVSTGGVAAPENPSSAAQATCVLSNPAYSGQCTQTTPIPSGSTPAQACQAVLECLNNPQCLKTYCDATNVRGGWKLESAK